LSQTQTRQSTNVPILKVNKCNSFIPIDKKCLLFLLPDAACQLHAFSGLECMSAHIEKMRGASDRAWPATACRKALLTTTHNPTRV
jgi:hypothetical protein